MLSSITLEILCEAQLKLSPHLEYLPEQSHLLNQYFDFANLEYTSKSTSTSLWPSGPLDNIILSSITLEILGKLN